MASSKDKIISIDISSNKVKVGLLSDKLELESVAMQKYAVINEDIDGFKKKFDMEDIWNKILLDLKEIFSKKKSDDINIIGISSCAQRIACVFLDKEGNEIYGGPNTDVRGIDSAYQIEDKFSDEDLFNITGHSPSLMFTLARLLYYKEQEEDQFNNIGKVLMLDDWIAYKLTGELVSDFTSVPESQLFDIKKMDWSSEIIEGFDFNPELFPKIVGSGTLVGDLKSDIVNKLGLKQKKIPVFKGMGDTLATLLGMGGVNEGEIGISLGTTAPVDLILDEPVIDPELNFWTTCHPIKGKWVLEANTGNTGNAYDWFKDSFFSGQKDVDESIESMVQKVKPGASSTFAFLGPEIMSFKDTTSIKRGVFVFQPPSMVSEDLPKVDNFARSTFENIAYGIFENYSGLQKFKESPSQIFCGGGMANSNVFCNILANVFGSKIKVPKYKDSAFVGNAMNVLKGLNKYPDYQKIIDDLFNFQEVSVDENLSKEYKGYYSEWKNLKEKLDQL